MNPYSKLKFIRTLDGLTSLAATGCRFGMPMVLPYRELAGSVNADKPIRLYRYFSTDPRNLADVEAGRVFLSKPSSYDDPYDSQPTFDLPFIRQRMLQTITYEGVVASIKRQRPFIRQDMLESYDQAMRQYLDNFELMKERVISATEQELFDRYGKFRDEIRCACFSERCDSSYMWGKYASECAGFVAAYDIRACDVACWCEKPTCSIPAGDKGSLVFSLCPILYDGRFDMSQLSHVLMDSCAVFPYPTFDVYLILVHACIHKSSDWESQHEWRLFTGASDSKCPPKAYARIVAKEIIVGPKTKNDVVARLKDAALSYDIPIMKATVDIRSKGDDLCILPLE